MAKLGWVAIQRSVPHLRRSGSSIPVNVPALPCWAKFSRRPSGPNALYRAKPAPDMLFLSHKAKQGTS